MSFIDISEWDPHFEQNIEPKDESATRPFSRLLESGDFSDLKIHCEDAMWKVHKAIICSQSEFFRAACNPRHGFKEATSGAIELHEVNRYIIQAVIDFLYTGAYEIPNEACDVLLDFNETMFHINVYRAADIYQVLGLKQAALEGAQEHVSHSSELPCQ
ncbi:BTB/POZ protein [Phyllosticta citricarpa]